MVWYTYVNSILTGMVDAILNLVCKWIMRLAIQLKMNRAD